MEGSDTTSQRRRRLSLTGERYRHPSDVARLVFAALLVAVVLLVDLLAPDSIQTIGVDILLLVDGLPDAVVDGLVGLVQVLATVAPLAVIVTLLRQRSWSQLAVVVGSAGFSVVGMWAVDQIVDERVPLEEFGIDRVNSWFVGVEYPPAGLLASLTAVLVALSPQMERRWRVTGWVFIVALVGARVLTATEVPVRNGLLLAVGILSGSLALVVFGAPRRRVDPEVVVDALGDVGLELASPPQQLEDHPMFAAATADGELTVKVFGRDQRDVDLLISGIRALTTKGLSDGRALRSPVAAADAEALALGLFRAAGASVPELAALTTAGDEAAVLAITRPGGTPLDEVGTAVDDEALQDLWRQISLLQDRRLAHRRLAASNVAVEGGVAHLIDLRWAEHDAADEVLGADVAELLISTALVVGAERAVSASTSALTTEQLTRALPLIQAAVCSPPTHDALEVLDQSEEGDADAFVSGLREGVASHLGLHEVDVAPIQRITVQGVVSLVGSAVLVWYILSLASDWDEIWDAFTRAELIYVIPILLLAGATYLTGALSLLGAVPIRLGFARTTLVMFGQSYLNRFTPANAGGMAMRVRYLQLQGLDAPVAATSIGLTSAASGVAQVLMIVLFLVWGGASDRLSDFDAPAIGPIVIGLLLLGLVASIVLASTWGRETLRPWLVDAVGKVRGMLRDIAADPTKMAQLLGGATLGKLANIAAFWLSAVAFDVDISFPKAGALYIIATTIGSAVPTPGGVGGVDAALTAALLGYGVGNADAAAIVLLFRMLTFWLPTLPGYVSLRYCQRVGLV